MFVPRLTQIQYGIVCCSSVVGTRSCIGLTKLLIPVYAKHSIPYLYSKVSFYDGVPFYNIWM